MSKVTIRTRPLKDGIMARIYLEFNPPINDTFGNLVRYEFLDLERFIDPKDDNQKELNKEVDDLAEGYRCDRYLSMIRREHSSFLAINRQDGDFLEYFDRIAAHKGIKFRCSLKYFSRFCNKECKFYKITASYCENFKSYLQKTKSLHRKAKLGQNSASSYFNAFMSVVQLAQKDGIIRDDVYSNVSKIKWNHDTKKEYLDQKEIKRLKKADFPEDPILKRAVLFSIYTGLRRGDIINLDWKDISLRGEKSCMNVIIGKTKKPATLPLSATAIEYLGKPKRSGPIFEGLYISKIHKLLPILMRRAKITKHITFHCFRHSYAVIQISLGTDIYTVSKMLTHKNVTTTQIYADLVNSKKRETANKISLK